MFYFKLSLTSLKSTLTPVSGVSDDKYLQNLGTVSCVSSLLLEHSMSGPLCHAYIILYLQAWCQQGEMVAGLRKIITCL